MICMFEDCHREAFSKGRFIGFCKSHAEQWRRGEQMRRLKIPKPKGPTCEVPGCGRKQHCSGLCNAHNKMRLRSEPLRKIGRCQMSGECKHHGCSVRECDGKNFGRGYCEFHWNIQRTYKFNPQEYEDALVRQRGLCAICGMKCSVRKRLSIDHDHKTGRFRGLLCSHCNTGIGKFFDREDLLLSAIRYLSKRRSVGISTEIMQVG